MILISTLLFYMDPVAEVFTDFHQVLFLNIGPVQVFTINSKISFLKKALFPLLFF